MSVLLLNHVCAIIASCRLGVACGRRAGKLTLRTSKPSKCPSGEGVMTGIFASRGWIVFACACGLLVGAGAILIFTFGVFLKPVTEDLGVTRGELSGALGVSTWFVAVSCPVIGWLIDRFGTRDVMIPGILLFALAVASFGLMQAQPLLLIYVIFCVAGFISGVQTPIPYAAVITHWFDSHRGIALGLATAGVGLGVALIPQLAAFLIGHFGWPGPMSDWVSPSWFWPGFPSCCLCATRRGCRPRDAPAARA